MNVYSLQYQDDDEPEEYNVAQEAKEMDQQAHSLITMEWIILTIYFIYYNCFAIIPKIPIFSWNLIDRDWIFSKLHDLISHLNWYW